MSTDQARTILGPLTTTYTAPSSCAVGVWCSFCNNLEWQAQSCFSSRSGSTTNYGVEDNTDCWPPRSSFISTPTPPLYGWGFYSPGLVCPNGMASACSATGSGSSGWPVQFGLLEQETAVGCCPSGFSCSNGLRQTCVQVATSTSVQAVTCLSGTSNGFTFFTVPSTVSTGVISQYTILAPLIQINWQSSDRPGSSATSITTSSTTSSTLLSAASPAPPQSLSTGAKAGIGVGVGLGVLAVMLLAIFIYRKRQNARRDSPTAPQPVYELKAGKGPYATTELPTRRDVFELSPNEETRHRDGQVHEIHG